MKISAFVIFILIVAGVVFTYAELVREANEQYDTNYINSSQWSEEYDYIDEINETVSPLETKLKIITDEDQGWFSRLTSGITAVPYVILIVPQAVFETLGFAASIIVGFFSVWGLPQKIITLALVILAVWGIFKLIEFFNKWEF